MKLFFRCYYWFLTGCIVVLIAVILLLNPAYQPTASHSALITYIRSALQGDLAIGVFSGQPNRLDFTQLQVGDILLGGNPGGSYGHFTHAGLYLGQGQVLEGYVDCGLSRQLVEHYRNYDWACILRVKLPEAARAVAAEYARQREGRIFYPMAFKPGERYWNCTKIIWAAYQEQGIDLDPFNDLWVTPDALYQSPWVEVVDSEGEIPL